MKTFVSSYLNLTKMGIVIFVLITGLVGYLLGFRVEDQFSVTHMLLTLVGLYCLSSGSLALNQVQEIEVDRKMERTAKRPLVRGDLRPMAALGIATALMFIGLVGLFAASTTAGLVGVATVLLYNVFYTMWWKPNLAFAAVPGAIPGALPVVIGFAANDANILRAECVYAFLIMFLWQMPHFWTLAIRFKEDYRRGQIPVLPAALGTERTLFHMGLYVFAYVFLALSSPWLIESSALYWVLILPLSIKVLLEFGVYFKNSAEKRWLPFFLWTNLSMLVFLLVPVADRWSFLIFQI